MRPTITAAVVQMCSGQDVEANLRAAARLVAEAARRGAQIVVIPENFQFIGGLRRKLEIAEALPPQPPGPILSAMIDTARGCAVHLLLGGMPVRSHRPDRFYNTSLLLDPTGEILASYRKIHLFDIDIPGGPSFAESGFVEPGTSAVTTELLGTCIGLSICYDLRFPELYRELVARGAEVLTVPAAFTLHTGKDHWLPLLRARAIENQAYVLAAGQHGRHNEERTSFGKSCIVDPWGAVIAQCSDGDGIALATLDLEYLERVRRMLPALAHRGPR